MSVSAGSSGELGPPRERFDGRAARRRAPSSTSRQRRAQPGLAVRRRIGEQRVVRRLVRTAGTGVDQVAGPGRPRTSSTSSATEGYGDPASASLLGVAQRVQHPAGRGRTGGGGQLEQHAAGVRRAGAGPRPRSRSRGRPGRRVAALVDAGPGSRDYLVPGPAVRRPRPPACRTSSGSGRWRDSPLSARPRPSPAAKLGRSGSLSASRSLPRPASRPCSSTHPEGRVAGARAPWSSPTPRAAPRTPVVRPQVALQRRPAAAPPPAARRPGTRARCWAPARS